MKTLLPMLALTLALTLLVGGVSSAQAQDETPTATTATSALPKIGRAVTNLDLLDTLRGGAAQPLSSIRANGSVSDVRNNNVQTGYNVITEGALSGAAGLPMVIQNSGNGVLIQNAVVLNVQVQ
ncbi:MAG TPA: hypothetical protein VLC92_15455 [Rhodocyclaceae bacterium]|nr:hypothetical protein [Rhodocyclaceae bacterium]